MKRLIVVAGPTASGKTACAVALCRRIGGEVVSADSMQLYRNMDIGTAKPSERERQGVVHHLLDVLDPQENCSAARYREMASAAIDGVYARERMPVLCGGTGLYIDAVTRPMGFSGQIGDEQLREQLTRQAEQPEGKRLLHDRLRAVDPDSAARLHPNDVRRVVRALEVAQLTGRTMTEQMRLDAARPDEYQLCAFALSFPRETLYRRIDERVDQMMRDGLRDEVERLLAGGLPDHCTAMQALGYKEMARAIRGEITQDQAVELIKQLTRNYAKRQISWFKRDARVQWLEASGKSAQQLAGEMEVRARAAGVL